MDPAEPGLGRPLITHNPVLDSQESDFRPLVGMGLEYQVLEPLAVRLEWVRYLDAIDLGNSKEDIDSLSLGVRFSF